MSKEVEMFIKALQSGNGHNFIFQNAQHLTFEELKGILIVCIYIITVLGKSPFVDRLADDIKARFDGY